MAKIITAAELAAIVSELLTGDAIGDADQFTDFMHDIANAVTDALGGYTGPARGTAADLSAWTIAFEARGDDVAPLAQVLASYDPDGEL